MVLRLKVQIAPPIDPLEHVREELGDVAGRPGRVVLAGGDPEVLGQRQLPLAEDRVGQREQFPRLPRSRRARSARCRWPAAADARRRRRRHGPRARPGSTCGITGPANLVDQLAEHRVFLRRAADHGKRPDRRPSR